MSAAGAIAGPAREPRPLLEVARDVSAMKQMSVPIVTELGRSLSRAPLPDLLASALAAQRVDTHRHVALCQALHVGRARPAPLRAPGYVRAFARAVALLAGGPARPHLLCVATVASTAVEAVAFGQLARRARRRRWRELFEGLARDQSAHFRLASGPLTERLRAMDAPRAPLRARALLAVLAAVALAWWWPARLAAYQRLGLDADRFVRALGAALEPALARLGVPFRLRLFVRVASAWLRVCGGLRRA